MYDIAFQITIESSSTRNSCHKYIGNRLHLAKLTRAGKLLKLLCSRPPANTNFVWIGWNCRQRIIRLAPYNEITPLITYSKGWYNKGCPSFYYMKTANEHSAEAISGFSAHIAKRLPFFK